MPLAVVEDLFPETKLEVCSPRRRAAPAMVVLDIGLMEI